MIYFRKTQHIVKMLFNEGMLEKSTLLHKGENDDEIVIREFSKPPVLLKKRSE